MRAFGLIALAAAGVGFLLYTDKGRALAKQATQAMDEGYTRLTDSLSSQGGVDQIVHKALDKPHEDTAMASAFDEAVAAA
jgi:hypothetical protein